MRQGVSLCGGPCRGSPGAWLTPGKYLPAVPDLCAGVEGHPAGAAPPSPLLLVVLLQAAQQQTLPRSSASAADWMSSRALCSTWAGLGRRQMLSCTMVWLLYGIQDCWVCMLDVLQVAHEHEVPGLVPAGVQGVMGDMAEGWCTCGFGLCGPWHRCTLHS